jgi:transcriptional regulator with XRE-family HTH domain
MALISRKSLIERIRRGKTARKQLVESHLAKTIAYQLRATRDRLGWSQERLAEKVGMNQNAISRLESPDYGRPTLTTLRRMAAALDVALVIRLVPFSEFVDWISGTPRMNMGLSTGALAVPTFEMEEAEGVFDEVATAAAASAATTDAGIPRKEPKTATSADTISRMNNETAQRDSGEVDLAFRCGLPQSPRLGSLAGSGRDQ